MRFVAPLTAEQQDELEKLHRQGCSHRVRQRAHAVLLSAKGYSLEYHALTGLLDALTDEVGEDESHPLASLMAVFGVLIVKYEDEHVSVLET